MYWISSMRRLPKHDLPKRYGDFASDGKVFRARWFFAAIGALPILDEILAAADQIEAARA
jgi:hypothetical protein